MNRIAIPISNGRLSEFFEKCSHFLILVIDQQSRRKIQYKHKCSGSLQDLTDCLINEGVNQIIAYRINKKLVQYLSKQKVNIYIGVHEICPDRIINQFLDGSLLSDDKIINEITGKNAIKLNKRK